MEIMPKYFTDKVTASNKKDIAPQTDEYGVPVFTDKVEVRITKPELYALHKTIGKALVDWNIIPMTEGPGTLGLITYLGNEEESATKNNLITLPVNYVSGVVKVLSFLEVSEVYKVSDCPLTKTKLIELKDRFLNASIGYARIKQEEAKEETMATPPGLLT